MIPRLRLVLVTLLLAACSSAASPTPSAAPSEVPTAELTASATASEEREASPSADETSPPEATPGNGFTVTPNPEADSLFLVRDECENPEAGYRLEYPDTWYTNTEIGSVPACSWFAPTDYEVNDPADIPDEIAITMELLQGDRGYLDEPIRQEEVIVGATQAAVRTEVESDGVTMYEYVVQLGPTLEEGPNLLARTDTEMAGDYELNKAVLDRIMATIEFIGSVQ